MDAEAAISEPVHLLASTTAVHCFPTTGNPEGQNWQWAESHRPKQNRHSDTKYTFQSKVTVELFFRETSM